MIEIDGQELQKRFEPAIRLFCEAMANSVYSANMLFAMGSIDRVGLMMKLNQITILAVDFADNFAISVRDIE